MTTRRTAVCAAAACLATAAALAGCATPRRASLPESATWSGRLGLQVQSEPPQTWSVGFELQGSEQQGELLLLSPIGTALAQLQWTTQSAQLVQGDRQWSGRNLDQLTQQLMGTALPLAALFDWLAGRPTVVPGWRVDVSQLAQGRVQAERQSPAPQATLRIVLDR